MGSRHRPVLRAQLAARGFNPHMSWAHSRYRTYNPLQFQAGGIIQPALKPGALQPLQPDLSAVAGAGVQGGNAGAVSWGQRYAVGVPYGVSYGLGLDCYRDPDGNWCCPQGDIEKCIAPGGYNFIKARGKTLKNPCDYTVNPHRRRRRIPSRYRKTRRALRL